MLKKWPNMLLKSYGVNTASANTARFLKHTWSFSNIIPLRADPTKWSNTIKQLVGKLPTNCLSVFDHSVGLVPKGLCIKVLNLPVVLHYVIATRWQSNMIKKSYDANHLEL